MASTLQSPSCLEGKCPARANREQPIIMIIIILIITIESNRRTIRSLHRSDQHPQPVAPMDCSCQEVLSEEEEKSQGESPEGRVQPDVPGLRGTSLTMLTSVGVLKRFALFAKPLFDQLAMVLVFLESLRAKATNLAAHVLASAM